MRKEITLSELEITEMIERELNVKEYQTISIYFEGGIINPKKIRVVYSEYS